MTTWLLPFLILVPLIAGSVICALGGRMQRLATDLATLIAGAMLVGAVGLLSQVSSISPNNASVGLIQPRVVFSPEWMNLRLPVSIKGHSIDWQLQLGADSFSASMVLLSAIVTLAILLTSRNQIKSRQELYSGLVLITQSLLIGVFLSMDLLLFYVFFEAVLLPIILLINIWGDAKESLKASRKFLLFTLAGSIPMVVGLVGLVVQSASIDKPSSVLLTELSLSAYSSQLDAVVTPAASNQNAIEKARTVLEDSGKLATSQGLILLTLVLGFGIKMAILPLHSWLPTTYAVAHPNTTALIASVVGKLGVYGLLRIVLPLTPLSLIYYVQFAFGTLGAIAIVYGAMIALRQTDLRRLLAYSSLSHMGFVTIGIMAMNREGLSGASIQMLNHGLITAAMFLLLGMIEERRGRLLLNDASRGLASAFPRIGTLMVFFTLAAAGLPGLNSFVGELLVTSGMLRVSIFISAIAILGTLLGAWYSLRVLQYLMFGSDGNSTEPVYLRSDIGTAELCALVPIALLCLSLGVYPSAATDFFQADVDNIAQSLEPAVRMLHPNVDSSLLVSQAK
ncbi:MAG: NADH-quinone oxidoreductase subunit M [Pirellulaceae bacterium]|nr:NADH-quinone oxidoreductase subunit M [Pirellulaceae bacterium]